MFLITGLEIKGNAFYIFVFCVLFFFRQEAGLRMKSVKKKKTWGFGEAERCLTRQLHALVEARLPNAAATSRGAASAIQGTASPGRRTRRPEGR